MVKRFALVALREDIRDHFGVSGGGGRVPPRYNIGASEPILVVVVPPRQTARRLLPARWGLIPTGAAVESAGSRRTSLRLATARRGGDLSTVLAGQRCLVPANGFYLWRLDDGRVRPFHVRRGDGGLFGLAAVWNVWQPPIGPPVHSCAVLLGPSNRLLADFGPEAPVVIPTGGYDEWLDPSRGAPDVESPWDSADYVVYPVSARVNDPRRDTAICVARAT